MVPGDAAARRLRAEHEAALPLVEQIRAVADALSSPGVPTHLQPVADTLDVFQRDRGPGVLGIDGFAKEPVVVEDPDLGDVARVVSQDDPLPDIGGARVATAQDRALSLEARSRHT